MPLNSSLIPLPAHSMYRTPYLSSGRLAGVRVVLKTDGAHFEAIRRKETGQTRERFITVIQDGDPPPTGLRWFRLVPLMAFAGFSKGS